MSIALVMGIGIFSFLMFYFSFQLEGDHFLLKLLLIFFALTSLILIPKAVFDEDCSLQLSQHNTTTINATITQNDYVYSTLCVDNQGQSSRSLLYLIYGIFGVFITYISVYIFWWWVQKNAELLKRHFKK